MNNDKRAWYISEIKNVLTQRDLDITLSRFKRYEGKTDRGTFINIDFRSNLLDTLVHECLHIIKPLWSEKKAYRKTAQIMASMTDNEAVELLYLLAIVIMGPVSPIKEDSSAP